MLGIEVPESTLLLKLLSFFNGIPGAEPPPLTAFEAVAAAAAGCGLAGRLVLALSNTACTTNLEEG